ncbi:MAG TPA: histidinol phosphate phosphatase, partial [Candidatus Methylacidiphilales bacterium]
SRFYGETLDAIAETGVAIEVSTAGLRKEVKEIYPSRQFLEMAFARGIPVLINSDSHKPSEIAHAYGEALALVREVGYTSLVRFEKRKRIAVPI